MGARGMQDVELLDEESGLEVVRGGTEGTGATRSLRRLRWWLAGVAAVLAVVLGGTQWLIRSREAAAVAQLAAVDGVVPPVDGPLEVGRHYSQADAAALLGQGGGLVRAPDGSLTYQWGEGSDDDPGWSKQLLGPVPALAGANSVSSASQCVPDVPPEADVSTATRVVCLITDGGTKFVGDDGMTEQVRATMTFVEVLDTAVGAPVAQWPAPGAQSFALLDGQIVMGVTGPDSDIFTGRDPLTGDVRWTHQAPLAKDQLGTDPMWRYVGVSRAGDLIAVRTTGGELRLLSADGHLVREPLGEDGGSSWNWQADAKGRPFLESWDQAGNGSVTLVAADANPDADRTLAGGLVPVAVDDGSLPDLLLTADSALHAWDAESGSPRWSSTATVAGALGTGRLSVLVVRGRVYLLSPAGLTALDGRTGKTLWEVEPDEHLVPTTLFTDAHHLLVGYERPARDSDPLVVAYDFAKGTEVSRAAYPNGVDHLAVWDGKLIGYDDNDTGFAMLS